MKTRIYKPAWWRRWTSTTYHPKYGHTRMEPCYFLKFQANINTRSMNKIASRYNHLEDYSTISCKELDTFIEQEKLNVLK